MKQIVLRSPVVLYETVEALYQHVNGLSVEGRKRDLLQKFGSKLTRTEREQIEQSCALAAKVSEPAPDWRTARLWRRSSASGRRRASGRIPALPS